MFILIFAAAMMASSAIYAQEPTYPCAEMGLSGAPITARAGGSSVRGLNYWGNSFNTVLHFCSYIPKEFPETTMSITGVIAGAPETEVTFNGVNCLTGIAVGPVNILLNNTKADEPVNAWMCYSIEHVLPKDSEPKVAEKSLDCDVSTVEAGGEGRYIIVCWDKSRGLVWREDSTLSGPSFEDAPDRLADF